MKPTPNPYVASEPAVRPAPFVVSHSRAINYVFENPNWLTNLLLVLLCMIIPLVGPIVVYGYQMEVIESLHRERGRRYPDFDFGRFSEYLSRGIWVFLVALILNLVAIPIIWMAFAGGAALIGLIFGALGPDVGPWSLIVTIPCFVILSCSAWMAMAIVSAPMVLRSGLTQDFGEGFNTSFATQFISNTWKQICVSTIFLLFFGFITTLAGALVFCVGMYVAIAYINMVMTHVGWQMYELHLSKGGMPIPIKPSRPRHYAPPQPPVKPYPPQRPM